MEKIVIIIPAYNPDRQLVNIIESLMGRYQIIVINDGSKSECNAIFDIIKDKAEILCHEKNEGKGKAIKTALHYYRNNCKNKAGVVLADADGQHSVEDIERVAKKLEETSEIILGVRNISKMPLKSKIGNCFMKLMINSKYKVNIGDTQTGLRGIPDKYVDEIAGLNGDRFEYETNMLKYVLKKQYSISQVEIETIYLNKIKSNFKIFKDSANVLKNI